MDNRTPLQPEADSSESLSSVEKRFKDDAHLVHDNEVWTSDAHAETSVEKNVRRTLHRIYFVFGIFVVVCISVLLIVGFVVYRQATYVDPVTPDYSSLDVSSDTYWTDRILIDIETAGQSADTDESRYRRLRTFVSRTVSDALTISSPYPRAQAVTGIAIVLAQHDINISLVSPLQRLGTTNLIVSMRARTLVSQALMHLRQGNTPAAQIAMQQYSQLVNDADLKLNSPINEESFFGAVTVLWFLNDRDGLRELFNRQTASTAVIGLDQRMRAYRLIAGEQARVGMTSEARETAKRISSHVELPRAWALILQYSARPPGIFPIEPTMLELLDSPQADSQVHSVFAERVVNEFFHYLAENKDVNIQVSLLQRFVSSRLIRDVELCKIIRQCLVESTILDDRVKQQVLRFLDNLALAAHQTDPTVDDWTTSEKIVHVEIVDIDSTPLRTRTDQQRVQALLAIAQGYQSIRRFHDADRVLKQAFVAAQRFVDSNIRIQLLLQIGAQQVTIGSIADAKQTFATVAPALNQSQKSELARLQIHARFFDDALATLSGIESSEHRESACSFLLREQIRINRLDDAEKTLSLMPQGRVATEAKSRLNIAREQASREDFSTLGLSFSEENNLDWERHCIELIQQGFLRLADQATNRIGDVQKRTDVRTRIAQEYLRLCQAFNDVNDPNRLIRQEMQQSIVSAASRIGQPASQTAILAELLMDLTGQLRTEEDRADGNRLWSLAMDSCRRITEPDKKATLFAQLVVARNMLDNPNLARWTFPLFTRGTNPSIYEENNRLIEECHELVNSLESEEQQGKAWVHLARALAQIGRTTSARMLLDHALDIAINISDREESVSMLLSLIPTLRAMNSADIISVVYRLAIDKIAHEFTNRSSNIDEFEWRVRDSEIERIVRSQMENGFIDDAMESASRLNEPLLRDRLFRAAAYFYLDHENADRAELVARRMMARSIQDNVLQNIQTIKRRPAIRP